MEVSGKVVPWGNSQGLRMTKEILSQLGWRKKQEVSMEVSEEGILIIKPIKPADNGSLESLFQNYKDDGIRETLVDFGDDVGQEII